MCKKIPYYPTHKTRDEPPFVDTGYSGDIEKDMIGCNGIYEGASLVVFVDL